MLVRGCKEIQELKQNFKTDAKIKTKMIKSIQKVKMLQRQTDDKKSIKKLG